MAHSPKHKSVRLNSPTSHPTPHPSPPLAAIPPPPSAIDHPTSGDHHHHQQQHHHHHAPAEDTMTDDIIIEAASHPIPSASPDLTGDTDDAVPESADPNDSTTASASGAVAGSETASGASGYQMPQGMTTPTSTRSSSSTGGKSSDLPRKRRKFPDEPPLLVVSKNVYLSGVFKPAAITIKKGKIEEIFTDPQEIKEMYMKHRNNFTESGERKSNTPVAAFKRGTRTIKRPKPGDLFRVLNVPDHQYVLPGIIDSHVHVNEPGRTDWEGFYTATQAAIGGGVTTIADMPLNSIPPTTTVENLYSKLDAAHNKCWCDVAFIGGVIPDNAEIPSANPGKNYDAKDEKRMISNTPTSGVGNNNNNSSSSSSSNYNASISNAARKKLAATPIRVSKKELDGLELRKMVKSGICGFKCFLIESGVDEFPHVNYYQVRQALQQLKDTNAFLMFHAELDPSEVTPPSSPSLIHRRISDPDSDDGADERRQHRQQQHLHHAGGHQHQHQHQHHHHQHHHNNSNNNNNHHHHHHHEQDQHDQNDQNDQNDLQQQHQHQHQQQLQQLPPQHQQLQLQQPQQSPQQSPQHDQTGQTPSEADIEWQNVDESSRTSLEKYQTFLMSRPRNMENRAIKMVIDACRESGVQCHIVHLSSSDAIPMIKKAKEEGVNLTVETCFHYLFFDTQTTSDIGSPRYKCCPPIREKENRELLWKALKEGVIDLVVSDHSPCTVNLKKVANDDIMKAWGGISSLQFGLSVLHTEGVVNRKIPFENIPRWMSEEPARLIGVDGQKGKIQENYDADLVIFNPEEKFTVTEEMLLFKNKYSAYVGQEFVGAVEKTILRGRIVYDRSTGVVEENLGPRGNFLLAMRKKRPAATPIPSSSPAASPSSLSLLPQSLSFPSPSSSMLSPHRIHHHHHHHHHQQGRQ